MVKWLWQSGSFQSTLGKGFSWLRQGIERYLYWAKSRDLRVPRKPVGSWIWPKWILYNFLETLWECQCLRIFNHLSSDFIVNSPTPLGPMSLLHEQPHLERSCAVHGCLPLRCCSPRTTSLVSYSFFAPSLPQCPAPFGSSFGSWAKNCLCLQDSNCENHGW